MKTFHCDECDQLVFFENVTCLKCGHRDVAVEPEEMALT